MFLKSVTLRGFKSFADKTALEFGSGITAIVGPNGSGKSNVVDALAWVLGTHSPKTVRGGAMADVIFAGAPGKAALGRASVEITIDNADGALPVEYSEVTLSRAMFASGENEYTINGQECRALDVQELLGDAGLGRENHTVVGQGRLDAVLNVKPEERRVLIEEAAGILKHRRRKERAVRKLDQTEAHVERLTDLLRELRRNLRPLERQAEAAQKHAELSAALAEVRVTRAVRELATLDGDWRSEQDAEQRSDAQLAQLGASLERQRTQERELERQIDELAPRADGAAQTHFRLSNLVERYRGLGERIAERRSGLVDAVEEPITGRDPEALRSEAAQVRATLAEVDDELATAREAAATTEQARRSAEHNRRAHEQAAAAESRRRAEARERHLRWEGEVSALRSSLAQAASEEGRLASQVSGARARRDELASARDAVKAEIQRLDAQETSLSGQRQAAEQQVGRWQRDADDAVREERELERRRASLEARRDAMRAASEEATEGAQVLFEGVEAGTLEGVVGPLAEELSVAEGMGRALAAALGPLGDAVVVTTGQAAREAIGFVREGRRGRVLLLVGEADEPPFTGPELREAGARPLADALDGPAEVVAALGRALDRTYAVADFVAACRLAEQHPDCVFVTVGGEVAGARGYAGGASGPQGTIASRDAAQQAEQQLASVSDELLRAHRRVADTDRGLAAAREELEDAAGALQEHDGQLTAAAERLSRLHNELAACESELETLTGQQADLSAEIAEQTERLQALEARGAEPVADADDGPDLDAERLDDELTEARENEVQARMRVVGLEQRREELAHRVGTLEAEAVEVERQVAERSARRQRRLAGIERCDELTAAAAEGLARAERSVAQAAAQRDAIERTRAEYQGELGALRARSRELDAELGAVRDARHDDELRRAQLRHALDSVRTRLAEELATDPDQALADARAAGEDGPLAGDSARDEALADEEERLVRKVALLGTVNPLALEEFEALSERHRFLSEQLDDLRTCRRDLQQVIDAVDEEIRAVFSAAFADVAAAFEQLFPQLFPGGQGRLVLTDPDDLLTSGIEVEARPPGKRVKRLSLLSGGERSLTALAVLFAVFSARPSPFYVLDEVEVALDDVNLQRFLGVLEDFKRTSQLLVVTHQRRTMEVADALYGISMQSGGVSKVISQRLSEPVPAS